MQAGFEGRGIVLAGDKEIGAVKQEFADVKVSNAQRAAFLDVLASNFFFACASASSIIQSFDFGMEQVLCPSPQPLSKESGSEPKGSVPLAADVCLAGPLYSSRCNPSVLHRLVRASRVGGVLSS